MMAHTQPIVGPAAYSDEWYALRIWDPDRDRPVVFGASVAAVVVGESPYSTPLQIYVEQRQGIDFTEEKEAMKFGKRFEGPILDEYEERTKRIVERNQPMYLSAEHSFMGATPDALSFSWDGGSSDYKDPRSVDAKNSNSRMFDRSGDDEHKFGTPETDQVPVSILFQTQQQMAVLGVDKCDVPVLRNGNEFLIYSVDRNEGLIEQIVSAERELAERIINGDPPRPNWSHEGTRRVIRELHGLKVGSSVTLGTEYLEIWNSIQRLRNEVKEGKELDRELTNRFLHEMRDAQVGTFEGCDIEVRRSVIADSIVTRGDANKLEARIGEIKRKGHERLTQKKVK